jgi:hypothetical protein
MAKKNSPAAKPTSTFRVPKETTLSKHLAGFRALAAANADSDSIGACLVSDPQTGASQCLRTDPATCKALKGVFIGGPCGG